MAPTTRNAALSEDVLSTCIPLVGADDDYDALLRMAQGCRYVLLGEATHGTHEFYAERARITRRLIEELGFDAVAVEADWPDAYRVNRYVRGRGDDAHADAALSGFGRFPTWMWRNRDVVAFVDWLRGHNAGTGQPAGFYGLDLYSMFTSIDEVLRYLDATDPEAAEEARERYGCFDRFDEDSQRYAYSATLGVSSSCEEGVLTQLHAMRARAHAMTLRDDPAAAEAFFSARQNAELVAGAEEYYRTMLMSGVSSWNLRDKYMARTLEALAEHLTAANGRPARIVVWAHNSHLGDARGTDVTDNGEWNVGQLVRERHGEQALLVGFSTHHGTVTAASDWGGPAERKRVRPSQEGSYEQLFHRAGMPRFLLPLRGNPAAIRALERPRLERAIGVIYRPQTEYYSHYFRAILPEQFDMLLHFDKTTAVTPLEVTPRWESGEAPETFPAGL